MRKSARTQIPPFFDNDPYTGCIMGGCRKVEVNVQIFERRQHF